MEEEKQELFARTYGSSASWDDYVRLVLHAVSVPMTVAGIYSDWNAPIEAIGFSWKTSIALCLCLALAIQAVVASREKAVARQFVWWVFGSTGAWMMFFASALFMGAGVWTNHQMSQRGRQYGVDKIMGDAGQHSPDSLQLVLNSRLAEAKEQYVADTTLASRVLSQALIGNRNAMLSHSFKLDGVRYTVASARAKAKAVKANHPEWSAGLYEHANRQKAAAESEFNASVASARAFYANTVAQAAIYHRKRDSTERASLLPAFARFEADETARRGDFSSGKALLDSSMWWVVIVTSFGSFIACLLKEGYLRFSGMKMEGEKYEPRKNKSKVIGHLREFLEDGFEVIAERLNDTRTDYKNKAKGKGAYRLPNTKYVFGSMLLVLTAFAFNQTSIFSEADMIEAKMLPTPWGHLMLFCCLVLLGFFIFHEMKKEKSTVKGGATTSPTPTVGAPPTLAASPTASFTTGTSLPVAAATVPTTVAPHISVSHVSGIPTTSSSGTSVASPTRATSTPGKPAIPSTKRKGKKATGGEMKKIDKRIRQRCRRAWEYKRDGKAPQSDSAYADYLEDKLFMEENGASVLELAEGRLNITYK